MQPKSWERLTILVQIFTQCSVVGWVKAQKNQLVILIGMIQAKLRADYSTQVGEAQANFGMGSDQGT
jgi:hypothetical protein